jgi:ABC-type phosphate/phosphonate transport system substrate-binding protein
MARSLARARGVIYSHAMIASARMYSWTAPAAAAWRLILKSVATRAGVPLEVLAESNPLSLDELWVRPDMGCVFMCGYPWALRRDRPRLLAAPVPSPSRFGGRPVYCTDFIVPVESPYARLEDTFGGVFAYSTEHSHSGYNAPRFHLLAYRRPDRPTLYAKTLGPRVRQRPVIDAVADGRADVGAVDAYALALLERHAPEATRRVRVIASTVEAPCPPLVASPRVDAEMTGRISAALVDLHRDPALTPAFADLLLSRFVAVDLRDFEVFLERRRAAEMAGYAKLA